MTSSLAARPAVGGASTDISTIVLVSQTRKLRLRQVRKLTQGHRVGISPCLSGPRA